MYSLIRPLLFKIDAEKAHTLTLSALHWLPKGLFQAPKIQQNITAMGIRFPHAVGLAAGLDKNGEYLDALSKLGFSFIEIGTVTPKPQNGNPRPRLFRIPEMGAIINRMGFNNLGVDALVNNVINAKYQGILGINIGKNKDTSLNHATDDYVHCLQKVYQYATYITINISSPNTPDLRQLQQVDYIHHLLSTLREQQQRLAEIHQREVPLVLKISPDEKHETLKHMTDAALLTKIAGIIATNTTSERTAVSAFIHGNEEGGLSGQPLSDRSTSCLSLLKALTGSAITLIGVGGINSVSTAQQKIDAGASLVQLYTGLIYQGPHLVTQLAEGINIYTSRH